MPHLLSTLHGNEASLARALLPPEPDPTEQLEERDRFLSHAYLVLGCALIEEYVEELFREFVGICATSDDGRFAGCYVSLAAKFADDVIGQNRGAVPRAIDAVPVLQGLYASKVIKPNNGVKRSNIVSLSKPLGLAERLDDECEALLVAADSLGAKRGRVAHIGTIEEEVRPNEARALVKAVLDGLPQLMEVLGLTHLDDIDDRSPTDAG